MKPIKNDTPGKDLASKLYMLEPDQAPLYQLIREGRLRRIESVDVRWLEDDLVPDPGYTEIRLSGEFRLD